MTRARHAGLLSISDRERIDEVCLAFEDEWLQGKRPLAEAYLREVPATLHGPLLHELLSIELEYRRGWGEKPVISDYLDRFADAASDVRLAFAKATSRSVNLGFLPGHHIGRYRIKSKLGAGAFGTVYLAWDERLHRDVAIKIPHRSQLDAHHARDRFLQEARTLAKLKHPGIVPVYDSGRLDDDRVYLVMQYVEGRSLRELMNSTGVDRNRAVEIVAQAAEAVHCAHRNGVVHRDLKPGNILIDTDGQVHVADFGLAVCEQDRRDGEHAGTLAYMAPEQLQGATEALDARADVWALGVMLYELLCGLMPFAGPDGRVIMEKVVREAPPPLSKSTRAVGRQLADVCHRCLEKRPQDRHPSAAELALQLRQCVRPRQGGTAVAIAGLTMAALLAMVLSLQNWDASLATLAAPGELHPHALDLIVWNPNLETGGRIRLSQHANAAVYADDAVRLEVRLNSPRFVYVVWIDSRGEAVPLFPWEDGDWARRQRNEAARQQLSLPNGLFEYWTMEDGPTGMETVVLLARRAPLPESISLQQLLAEFQGRTLPMQSGVWRFVNGQRLRSKQRGPSLRKTMTLQNPLLQLQWRLADVLRPHFELVQTLSFPFRSSPSSREMISAVDSESAGEVQP
jgi:tRNA A-37 threonylcarbamoyl transferase component Bud32